MTALSRIADAPGALKRRLYRGGRPGRFMRWVNQRDARLYASAIAPRRAATIEVIGRRSGRVITLPVAVADLNGQEYLVSMLGDDARPHVPVDPRAPLGEFERVAHSYPVFRIRA